MKNYKLLIAIMIMSPLYAADNEIYIDQTGATLNLDAEQLGSGNIIGGADAIAGTMTALDLDGGTMTLDINQIGSYKFDDSFNNKHIDDVLGLDLVDVELIKSKNFKVVLDAVNSTGGFIIPRLLEKLGVECVKLYCEPNGQFPHNPEPLPENLYEISKKVVESQSCLYYLYQFYLTPK
jgi:phosphomannomutase